MVKVAVKGVVYNVDGFMQKHPGGDKVLSAYDDMDATDVFVEFHGENTHNRIRTLPVVDVYTKETSAFTKAVRKVREDFVDEGMFQADPLYYAQKLLEIAIILSVATTFMILGWWHVGAFFVGLFFQQSGWLAHDFAHNQVTRKYRFLFTVLVANLYQGFSGTWWIRKHMLHHAKPNAIHEETGEAVEEDFDTAPLLYWTGRMIPSNMGWFRRAIISMQGYYLWLVLPLSKFVWDFDSLKIAIMFKTWTELVGIIVHYALCYLHASLFVDNPIWFMIVSRLWGGFLISWVFIQSHNGMTYYDRPAHGYYESQIMSTRNMDLGKFSTWFTGGLNYQIEHHFFPRMPRHNLPLVANRVREVCETHGYCYQVMGIVQGSIWITKYLNKIGRTKND